MAVLVEDPWSVEYLNDIISKLIILCYRMRWLIFLLNEGKLKRTTHVKIWKNNSKTLPFHYPVTNWRVPDVYLKYFLISFCTFTHQSVFYLINIFVNNIHFYINSDQQQFCTIYVSQHTYFVRLSWILLYAAD